MEIISGIKVFDFLEIDCVAKDLEARGANCTVNVVAISKPDDTVGYILQSINVRWAPDINGCFGGRKWDIVDIELSARQGEKGR